MKSFNFMLSFSNSVRNHYTPLQEYHPAMFCDGHHCDLQLEGSFTYLLTPHVTLGYSIQSFTKMEMGFGNTTGFLKTKKIFVEQSKVLSTL